MVHFPQEETGMARKLSRPPWHGPYQVKSVDDPDVTVNKVCILHMMDKSRYTRAESSPVPSLSFMDSIGMRASVGSQGDHPSGLLKY